MAEITSPYGRLPAGMWWCETCPEFSGLVGREPGDDGTRIRAAAAQHARSTGTHAVKVLVGLEETLAPLRTEPPVTRQEDPEHAPCPDGGKCHHQCAAGKCFRVACCVPLSGVYPGDRWPPGLPR